MTTIRNGRWSRPWSSPYDLRHVWVIDGYCSEGLDPFGNLIDPVPVSTPTTGWVRVGDFPPGVRDQIAGPVHDAAGLVRGETFPMHELVSRLRDLLGAKLVAYLGSESRTLTVQRWVDPADESTPQGETADRLRAAYAVAILLGENASPALIQAWFQGQNPGLGDVSPARALREGDLVQVIPMVVAAAVAARHVVGV